MKHEGMYYMTYSANSYESPFTGIGCTTATDVNGPWTKYEHNPVITMSGRFGWSWCSAMFRIKTLRIVFPCTHKDKVYPSRAMYIGKVKFVNKGKFWVKHVYRSGIYNSGIEK